MTISTRSRHAAVGLASILALAFSAGSALAATTSFSEIIRTTGPELVGTETRIVTENGQRYEETVKTYRTDTTTRTTTRTSRTVTETNTANYDYDVYARFRDTTEKWYNSHLYQDSTYGSGVRRLTWGSGTQGPSRYSFDASTRDDVQAGQQIRLGGFQHINNTIKGGITGTTLDVLTYLTLDSGRRLSFGASYYIDHNETWDWAWQGGVADTFTISDERGSWRFTDGDTSYTFSLLGFHEPWRGYNQGKFTVNEGSRQNLNLLAQLTSFTTKTVWDSSFRDNTTSSYTTQTMRMPVPVPLPAGGALLIGALGAFGLVRRSRQTRAA